MEENKMVKIEDLKDKEFREAKAMVKIKPYVPIRDQVATINALVGVILTRDEYGMLNYNSVSKDIMTDVAFVSLATNIELLDDDYDNYDILQATGLLEYLEVYANCGLYEFRNRLDVRIEDIMRENDVEHILAVRTDEMLTYFNRTLKHVETMLDKGDPNKIAKYLSKGVEAIANKLPDMSVLEVADRFKSAMQPKAAKEIVKEEVKENIEEVKEDQKVN